MSDTRDCARCGKPKAKHLHDDMGYVWCKLEYEPAAEPPRPPAPPLGDPLNLRATAGSWWKEPSAGAAPKDQIPARCQNCEREIFRETDDLIHGGFEVWYSVTPDGKRSMSCFPGSTTTHYPGAPKSEDSPKRPTRCTVCSSLLECIAVVVNGEDKWLDNCCPKCDANAEGEDSPKCKKCGKSMRDVELSTDRGNVIVFCSYECYCND